MDRGTYIAASGGFAQLRKLDVVSNNLANVNTPGFKRQIILGDVQTFDQTLARLVENQDPHARPDHERTPGTVSIRTSTDFTTGSIKHTGNNLDVALRHPNDFFVIQGPNGNLFTRAGNFSLNTEGELVTVDGYRVLGDGGPITTGGAGVTIAPNGAVQTDGEVVGQLQVMRFESPDVLERVGATRFSLKQGAAPPPVQVEAILEPKSLEMSNVSTLKGVVDLIDAQRGFQMYEKTTQTIDQMNQISVTRLGRRGG